MLQNLQTHHGHAPDLTPLEWRALLEDIGRAGMLLGHDAASRAGLTPRVHCTAATPLEQLHTLREIQPRIVYLVHALACCPDRKVLPLPRSVPLPQSRGGLHVASRVARHPSLLATFLQAPMTTSGGTRTALITEPRPATTIVTSENLLIGLLLTGWQEQSDTLATLAGACGEAALAQEGRRLSAIFRRLRCSAPWGSLPAVTEQRAARLLSGEGLLHCSARCRSLFALWQATHAPLALDWSDGALLHAALQEPWRLYEIWCYLRVALCLHASGWIPEEADCFHVTVKGLRLALATGRRSRIRFRKGVSRIELLYQPLYPGSGRRMPREHNDPGVSRTHAMQPDIALLHAGNLYLCDAKFRGYAPGSVLPERIPHTDDALLADLDKMHAYRDAISGVVQAWCLYPGTPEDTRMAIAYPESTPQNPFGTAGIGAVRLRPGHDVTGLERLLQFWIEGAS
ncbi:MAG: nuclease domain-containing protein [Chloroherpetonaceae bacterium]|nr:nuclease domain-containing protein [Chthonomonadaceae bacterium]MDW8209049.1 nuclease domain-containing protein [Chloroherpetonaceae bacterium]